MSCCLATVVSCTRVVIRCRRSWETNSIFSSHLLLLLIILHWSNASILAICSFRFCLCWMGEMNGHSVLLTTTYSTNWTSTTVRSSTISSIPHREQVLIDAFNTYIQIGIGSLLFLLGLTFNCLSLLYFAVSRSFRQTTFQLYFSIISILDTIRLLEFLVFLLFDKGYLKVTLILCRLIFFTIMFTGQVSQSFHQYFQTAQTENFLRQTFAMKLISCSAR